MGSEKLDTIDAPGWVAGAPGGRPGGGPKQVGDFTREELEARGTELRRKMLPVLQEEYGEDFMKEHEFLVVGMPKSKVEGFELRETGQVWGAQNAAISEIFAHRAVGKGQGEGVGAVVLVVERGDVDLRSASKPVDDAPQMIEYVLEGRVLEQMAKRADVIEMPDLFDDG